MLCMGVSDLESTSVQLAFASKLALVFQPFMSKSASDQLRAGCLILWD